MGNEEFARIGLFVLSAFLFRSGTALIGGFLTYNDKQDDDLWFIAWLVGVITYGISFTILWNMKM